MRGRLPVLVFLIVIPTALAALDALPSRPTTLAGYWRINTQLSDDAAKLLAQRLEKEYAQDRRFQERIEAMRAAHPEMELQFPAPSPEKQRRRHERLEQMLGITEHLEIVQNDSGEKVEIRSDSDSRRFVAGTHSQVSMPEGELADSDVGWDGNWFVIERRARGGPRVVEKYRLVPKTGQLESIIAWSGETVLSGIKVRRIFDRTESAPPRPDAANGPVRE